MKALGGKIQTQSHQGYSFIMQKVVYSFIMVFIKLCIRSASEDVCVSCVYVKNSCEKCSILFYSILVSHFNFSFQWVGSVFLLFVVSKFVRLHTGGWGPGLRLSLRASRSGWKPPGLDSHWANQAELMDDNASVRVEPLNFDLHWPGLGYS